MALLDLFRGARLAWSRAQLALVAFLTCEVLGLVAAGALWLFKPLHTSEQWLARNAAVQRRWVEALFGTLRRLYGLSLVVEGGAASAREGRLVVLVRHTSLIDTLLPVLLLDGWRLRYVLKQELRWDPCLDVVGQRIPNVFVRRGSGNAAAEEAKVAALAAELQPREAVVIFPEGTRYSASKRQRILASLARGEDSAALERAQGLRFVLPPRTGGTRALLQASPEADVVVLSHTGLEGAQTLQSLVNGDLIGRELRVRLERFPAEQVPREAPALRAWLWDAWQRVDVWVEDRQEAPPAEAITNPVPGVEAPPQPWELGV
jgi:1-acyl-sn-glycerol-3-phosphate acyltransferase